MHFKYRLILIFIVIGYTCALFAGCGTGSSVTPIVPEQNPLPKAKSESLKPPAEKQQWGTWIIRLRTTTDNQPASVEILPFRAAEAHINVTGMLLPPKCTNCLEVNIDSIINLDWTLKVRMTNPTIFTAYDVMGVFPGKDCPTVLSPDAYTDMYDADGNYATHNPCVVFNTGNYQYSWGPGESHERLITFRRNPGEAFTDIIYVVAASWPENQEEVVKLFNANVSGFLHDDGSNPVTISVDTIDWQNNIEYVLINLEPVNGSAYTHMQPAGGGVYKLVDYSKYGLPIGKSTLMIAAKSKNSDYLTYTYVDVEVVEAPDLPGNFDLITGPVLLSGEGKPFGEMDLSVVGRPDGTSRTMVFSSSTSIHSWNTDYSDRSLYLNFVDTSGSDPNFPINPPSRIAVTDPVNPASPDKYSILQTNLDTDIYNSQASPKILFRNVLQIVDLENLDIIEFLLTADNTATSELDAILRPVDVAAGIMGDKAGYSLWIPDGGGYPIYYQYAALVRYEFPYKNENQDFDTLIGGIPVGTESGKINSTEVNGLAVWDGGGLGNLMVIVSEGGLSPEVEIFNIDYLTNPKSKMNLVKTVSGFAGAPLDIAILPVGDAGLEDENWICILTQSKTIEIYTISGAFVESVYDPVAMPYTVKHLDVDTENLRIHVIMAGPRVSVFQYTGM